MKKAERQWALPSTQLHIVCWSWAPSGLWTGGTRKWTKLHSVLASDIWYLGDLTEPHSED